MIKYDSFREKLSPSSIF